MLAKWYRLLNSTNSSSKPNTVYELHNEQKNTNHHNSIKYQIEIYSWNTSDRTGFSIQSVLKMVFFLAFCTEQIYQYSKISYMKSDQFFYVFCDNNVQSCSDLYRML